MSAQGPPGKHQRPGGGNRGAEEPLSGGMPSVRRTTDTGPRVGRVDVAAFGRRLVLDAVADASANQWEARARLFEAARPRPDDFHGRASVDDLRRRWIDLTEAAAACRARAAVIRSGDDAAVDLAVDVELGEAS